MLVSSHQQTAFCFDRKPSDDPALVPRFRRVRVHIRMHDLPLLSVGRESDYRAGGPYSAITLAVEVEWWVGVAAVGIRPRTAGRPPRCKAVLVHGTQVVAVGLKAPIIVSVSPSFCYRATRTSDPTRWVGPVQFSSGLSANRQFVPFSAFSDEMSVAPASSSCLEALAAHP